MGLIATLEKWLEKTVEGFFNKGFSGQIQPIEIAKRLVREMENSKTISISKIYVPNYYVVYLHPEDYVKIQNFQQALAEELGEYLLKQGLKAKYIFLNEPVISFAEDNNILLGHMRLENKFLQGKNETTVAKQADSSNDEITDTKMQPVVSQTTQIFSGKDLLNQSYGELLVIEGPDKGKVFSLTERETVIGRKKTNQIALNDSNVSRCHAKINYQDGIYTIIDIDSTNGTIVNDSLVKEKMLKQNDTIEIGTTVLLFKVV